LPVGFGEAAFAIGLLDTAAFLVSLIAIDVRPSTVEGQTTARPACLASVIAP